MAGNKSLTAASIAKDDEFYTQLPDIENELRHYTNHFKNKTVLCNCDDPYESNFFKFFAMNFNRLGLKKLMATCYSGSPVAQTQLVLFEDETNNKKPFKIEINKVEDENNDGRIDLADVEYLLLNDKNTLSLLEENGDFRSTECIELLKQSDIIATNPPFSLFREYVNQLITYQKEFIILGNKNALTYKEIFPLVKDNKIWVGNTPMSREIYFDVPQSYIEEGLAHNRYRKIVRHNNRWMARSQSIWFTNLDIPKRHEEIPLYKHYDPNEYQTYDDYNAINIDRVIDIPYDYNGIMGVPITFLDKYDPEQFEIVGLDRYVKDNPHYGHRFHINGKETYARILIKRKNP